MARERILLVDDEPGVRSSLGAILEDEGYDVVLAGTGEDGLAEAASSPFDAILLDVWLPGMDGLDTLAKLREARDEAAVVMISGHGTIDTAVRATKLGAFDFVEKPLSLEKTLLVLRNALRQRRLERRNRALLQQLGRDTEILGASRAAGALRSLAEAAATSDSPVLLRGEPGTGRETIARRIHATGRRGDGPFVAVPCGALDALGGEEALFGPAASGGRLALASGGSVFLEEVHRLPEAIQLRLASTVTALAESEAGLRALASTGPEAAGIVPELARRLDVVRVDVPPLRERREDIEVFATRFMRDLAREYGRDERRLAPDALATLRAHAWPGNVRELRNVVERLLLAAPGATVHAADLPAELGGARTAADDLYREFRTLAEGIESFERYYVRRAWSATRGDLEAVARALGVPVEVAAAKARAFGLA
ncbi:MAG TPA: sigma-54 dependent transcriptional regulator [Candidatus Polarisedimenticolaceae bacterium]